VDRIARSDFGIAACAGAATAVRLTAANIAMMGYNQRM
jgi:hypothetical protein